MTNGVTRYCRCVVKHNVTSGKLSEISHLKEMAQNASKHLILDKKTSTKYKRLFVSTPDERPSSVQMGTVAIGVLLSFTVLLTIADVWQVLNWAYITLNKLKH